MLQILRSYGIPKKIASAIGLLQNNTKSSVLVGYSVSKPFDVNIGVLQGDTLVPFLFVIVLDWVMRQATVDNPGFVMIPRHCHEGNQNISSVILIMQMTLLCYYQV